MFPISFGGLHLYIRYKDWALGAKCVYCAESRGAVFSGDAGSFILSKRFVVYHSLYRSFTFQISSYDVITCI